MTSQGTFVWYELMTSEPEAAARFYERVVGWSARDSGMPGMSYTLLLAGETRVAGIVGLPQAVRDAGGPPGWMGYVAVDDVDAVARQAVAAGGTLHRPPDDIPGIGRFAVLADPQGAVITLFKGQGEPPPPAAPGTGGLGGWHELLTTEWRSAFDFYAGLFGWTKGQAVDMGPMSIYQLFGPDGGADIGGMMSRPPEMPVSAWTYYFIVPSIEDAANRVREAGGQITFEPHEVPGGSWILQGTDPQGARFALVAPPR